LEILDLFENLITPVADETHPCVIRMADGELNAASDPDFAVRRASREPKPYSAALAKFSCPGRPASVCTVFFPRRADPVTRPP